MSEVLQTISPVDGSVYVERSLASLRVVDETLDRAVRAQRSWCQQPLEVRQQLAHKAIDLLVADREEIAEEITWQMGRPVAYTSGEVKGAEERARYMIDIAGEALDNYRPRAKQGFTRFIAREPVGVVLVVAPWNYPYLTAINSIIPALVAGNAVILKHSSQTPLCAERFAKVFSEAGLPSGVFQFLHLSHSATETMMADSRLSFINFTGSVSGGHRVQQAINGRFITAGLELGGKDPAYVREDVDLPSAIENLVDGAFFNSGQSCCGIERIYVHESQYDDFIAGFVQLTEQYRLGDPSDPQTTLGPMVRASAADFVRGQVDDAVDAGARALIDEPLFPCCRAGTPYLAPQVLIDVNHSMRVMQEESFGPVVGIMPVTSDAAAIHLMNDSDFGLTASVWTRDEQAAIAIGQQVETGTFFMNRCDYLDPALVWTGVKDTGRGGSLSVYGYDAVTRLKSFHLKN